MGALSQDDGRTTRRPWCRCCSGRSTRSTSRSSRGLISFLAAVLTLALLKLAVVTESARTADERHAEADSPAAAERVKQQLPDSAAPPDSTAVCPK
jgi:hypothetical protein